LSKNRIVSFLVIMLFIFSLETLGTGTTYANSSPSIFITPEASGALLYSSLNVNLSISDVTDLYLWAVTIEWNSTILNLLDYSQGPFLKQGGTTTFLAGKVTAGKIEGLTCSLLGSVPGVNGSGTLATLQFNATATGTTSINITFSDILNSKGNSITHNVVNGTVNILPPQAFMATIYSPANLYVTDPENRHIGTHPTTGEPVNEIPGAFYSGPGSHPQRIIIPNPLDGVYDIKIVGTSTGSYTLVVELATVEKTTTHTYTGNISVGQIQESQATISEGEMTSTSPSTPPVGGIYIPINKLSLLAPYIGLTILLAVAVTTVIYVRVRKRKKSR